MRSAGLSVVARPPASGREDPGGRGCHSSSSACISCVFKHTHTCVNMHTSCYTGCVRRARNT